MRAGFTGITTSRVWFSALLALALLSGGALAQPPGPPQQNAPQHPFVSPIFGDHMVLQRGKPNAIWGWSDPGDPVRVQVGGHAVTASAGSAQEPFFMPVSLSSSQGMM